MWANLPELNWLLGYKALVEQLSTSKIELLCSWAAWPRGYMADLTSFSWKGTGSFNETLWRTGTDCVT